MFKKRLVAIIISGICSVYLSASVFAGPNVAGQNALIGNIIAPPVKLLNGTSEIANWPCNEQGEFPSAWTKELVFVRAPETVCVRWSTKSLSAWGQWELYKVTDGSNKKIASGKLTANQLTGASTVFQIQLRPTVPELNTSAHSQRYYVLIRSKKQVSNTTVHVSSLAYLVHQPTPPPANPYSCNGVPQDSARKVVIEIPKMTVNQTSNTSGDGDRDELYFRVSRIGPNTQSSQDRLPGADDYYEAKNAQTVNVNGWTNQNETHINNPLLWSGTLSHGESALLSVTAMEQDNADLQSVKEGIIDAMHSVAAIASAVGGAYGPIVAAVAEAVAGGSELFIPNTERHDFVGFVALKVSNQCGYIQTVWTTFSSKNTAAGKVSNQFLNVGTLENIESRLAVLDANPLFWPDGVNWLPYAYTNKSDQFWWLANGSSNSKYTFLLKAKAEMP